MQSFWPDLLISVSANIISDLFLWAVLFLISFGLIKQVIRYWRLLRFFGLSVDSNHLLLYLSSISVPMESITDRFGKKHPFELLTLSANEMEAISWLSVLLAYTPLQKLPPVVQELVSRLGAFPPIQTEQKPSPFAEAQLEHKHMIIIGGPYFNSAAKYFQEKGLTFLKFNVVDDYTDQSQWINVEVTKGQHQGKQIPTNEKDDLGVLERFTDDKTGSTIIWVAGARTNGTKAAAYYLVHQWSDLQKKYSNKDFALCLRCNGRTTDPEGYRKSSLILELSR